MNLNTKFVVETKVQVKPGDLDKVAKLFAETNPALVNGEPDWLEALFLANPETNEVTVLAFWADDAAYRRFSSGAAFKNVMSRFAEHLAGPPTVSVKTVLVGMTRESTWSFDV